MSEEQLLIRVGFQIFCEDLEDQLDLAVLTDRFKNALRTANSNQGFELRKPDSLRDLVAIATQLPTDNAFELLFQCVSVQNPGIDLPEVLHLIGANSLKLLQLASAVDTLHVQLRNHMFLAFLADFGAKGVTDYEQNVYRFLKRLIVMLPTKWYESLVLAAVSVDDGQDLLEKIAPFSEDFSGKVPQLQEQLANVCSSSEFQQAVKFVTDHVSRWVNQNGRQFDATTLRLLPATPVTEVNSNGSHDLHDYQEELAEPAIAGHNSIIIAPTGSGKTLVAIRVTEAVLEKEPNARIAFLVPTTNLVKQQYDEFKRCLPDRWRDRVTFIHGGSDDNSRMPISQALKDFSVIVLTTQILLNELKRSDGLQGDVSVFRLIIFDECHNCLGNHPSYQVMGHYMRMKLQQPDKKLPQVLGLTASPGTGKASRLDDAVDHLLRLCASLDCSHPVTVQRCIESLKRVTSDPDCQLHPVGTKSSDMFNAKIDILMGQGENLILGYRDSLPPSDVNGLPLTVPLRCSPSYVSYCANLKYNMHLSDPETSKNILACSRYLGCYNKAQMISQFFRSADALTYLEQQLRSEDELRRPPTCEAENTLRERLTLMMPQLLKFSETPDARASPPLEKLEEILEQQFSEKPESHAIVFVQEKFYAKVLAEYLSNISELRLAITYVTGATCSGTSGGTNAADQQAKLADFRAGNYRVIACTSVTEEGLDIPACNLVVRYCHVTNEISMVQSKGRGRALDSSYHVIIAESQEWLYDKERTNQQRDKMMRDAVLRVTAMSPTELKNAMATHQAQQEAKVPPATGQAAAAAAATVDFENAKSDAHDVVCGKCQTQLTSSHRLRLIEGIHRVALDGDLLRNRLRGESGGDGKRLGKRLEMLGVDLICVNCGFKVAKLASHSQLYFPMIAIEGVLFWRRDTQAMERAAKKWKQTEEFLRVQEISRDDKRAWSRVMPRLPDELLELV